MAAATKEEIIRAAEELEASGQNPTLDAVRKHLGGGSFTTISPALREWKAGRGREQSIAVEMPLELKASLEKVGSEFWEVANRISNEKLVAVQAEASAAVSAAEGERDELLKDIYRLEQSVTEATEANEAAEASRQQVEKENLRIKEEVVRLQEQLAHSRTEAGELKDRLQQAVKYKDQFAEDTARLRGLNEEVRQELQLTRKQLDNKTEQLDAVKRELSETGVRVELQKKQIIELSDQAEALKATRDKQDQEVLSLKSSITALETRDQASMEKIQSLMNDLSLLDGVRADAQAIQVNHEVSQSKIAELTTRLKALDDENKALIQKNGELTGQLKAIQPK